MDVDLAKLSLSLQSGRCPCKVVVVLAKSSLSLQSCLCPCKVDVLLAKLTLFVQRCSRSLHKVDVVCTKFCTKKEESWQVNFDIKTAS